MSWKPQLALVGLIGVFLFQTLHNTKPVYNNEAPKQPKDSITLQNYELVWSDEFNVDGRPDSSKWIYERGFVRNEELQWYQSENAHVENGLLVIEARKESFANPRFQPQSNDWRKKRDSVQFTSSCLLTRGKAAWQYGRFELRAKIDIRSGLWPAWWTLGDGPWPANGEIDIMEYYRGKLLANIACLGPDNKALWFSKTFPTDSLGGAKWADSFHVWRMDWTEQGISLYVDDHLLNYVPLSELNNRNEQSKNPFKQPHYMLLNLALGGMNGGALKNTSFPNYFLVDYVRVFQKK